MSTTQIFPKELNAIREEISRRPIDGDVIVSRWKTIEQRITALARSITKYGKAKGKRMVDACMDVCIVSRELWFSMRAMHIQYRPALTKAVLDRIRDEFKKALKVAQSLPENIPWSHPDWESLKALKDELIHMGQLRLESLQAARRMCSTHELDRIMFGDPSPRRNDADKR